MRFTMFGSTLEAGRRWVGCAAADGRASLRQIWASFAKLPFAVRAIERMRESFAVANDVTGASDPHGLLREASRALRAHCRLVIIFSAAINLLYLAPSLYMMQLYDRVLPTNGVFTLVLLSIVLLASVATMGALDMLRARLVARGSLRIERLTGQALMRQALSMRRAQPCGDGQVGIRDLDTLRAGLSSPAVIGVLDFPWTPLFIFVCFVIHFWIGMLALGGAVLIFLLALQNERASRASLQAMTQRSGAFYAAHDSDLQMAESVHALGAERALMMQRLHLRESLADAQTQAAFESAGYSSLAKTVRMILQSAALGLGCFLAVKGEMSPGAIIAVSILTARAYSPVEQIVGGWRQMGMGFSAFLRLTKAFERTAPGLERTPLPAPEGRVTAEAIAGAAPGGRVFSLQGASFSAGPGDIVGIIGPSGAGKTTLARLLANAAPVLGGSLRLDGARYDDWEQQTLARHIGYLPQRIDLLDGAVSENIACFARLSGEPNEIVGPKVVEAAQLSGAHEMILGLPNGYETVLGFGGAGLSPGQAQRIALARAFYDKPRVLVLDEPNSHLDGDGEAALVKALLAAKEWGAVSFVVAHRAGVLAVANKIIVLRDGRVSDFGPTEAVLARLAGQGAVAARLQAAAP